MASTLLAWPRSIEGREENYVVFTGETSPNGASQSRPLPVLGGLATLTENEAYC